VSYGWIPCSRNVRKLPGLGSIVEQSIPRFDSVRVLRRPLSSFAFLPFAFCSFIRGQSFVVRSEWVERGTDSECSVVLLCVGNTKYGACVHSRTVPTCVAVGCWLLAVALVVVVAVVLSLSLSLSSINNVV